MINGKVIIRKANEKDLGVIAEIFRIETAKEPYKQEWTRKTALDKIKGFFVEADIYVPLIEGEIVGLIICKISSNKESVYVDELWLKQKNQGKEIGKALMRYVEDFYRKKGVKKVSLVSDKRSAAFKFYQKLKYQPHSENIFLEKILK